MQYRTLGKTGLRVSLLGMGCMRLPFINGDSNQGVDRNAAIELLQFAANSGINYFDTAFGYHSRESESILGEAFQNRREKVIYATKQPWWVMPDDNSIRVNLEATLKKLRTGYIDCYLLHRIIPEEWDNIKKRGILKHFENFKREGLIRHIGFSYHGDYETFKKVVSEYPWEMCMVQQNMLDIDREVTQAGLEFAGRNGLGITIMEPLRGGGLAFAPKNVKQIYDKFSGECSERSERHLSPNPNPLFEKSGAKTLAKVARLRDFNRGQGDNVPLRGSGRSPENFTRTPAEWAFRHLVDSPYVSTIPSGMSSMKQVRENVVMFSRSDMVSGCLSQREKETIAAARDAYNSIVSIPCTTCDYCVPCPEGVQIPGIFSQYNEFKMFEHSQNPRRVYMFTTRAGGDVTKCNNCGKCVKKCPQKIDIPRELKIAHEVLKGWNE